MDNKRVGAIIISYNDFNALKKTIEAVYNQVESIVIVDNGSNNEVIKKLNLIRDDKIKVIFNNENLGIAAALNIGIEFNKKIECEYTLTLDQDSIASEFMVEKLLEFIADESVGIVCSKISCDDRKNNNVMQKEVVITSGNLIRTELFDEVGYYTEEMFIDSVDFDFCLRVSDLGKKILEVNSATMNHRLGSVKKINLINYRFIQHSYTRNYYMCRNHIYLIKKHWGKHKKFLIKKTIFMFKLMIENLLFNDNRWKVFKYSMIGVRDGICCKYGRIN